MEDKYPCPGHEGKCQFCKEENGKPRYVGSSVQTKRTHEIDPMTHRMYTNMEPIIDYCCHYCGKNAKAEKKQYQRTSIS